MTHTHSVFTPGEVATMGPVSKMRNGGKMGRSRTLVQIGL